MEKIEKRMANFKIRLLRTMPFYGDIVVRLNFISDMSVKTACTDGYNVFINPRFANKLSDGAFNYVVMHEIYHVILLHCSRGKDTDPERWNVACDMIVNNMLDNIRSAMIIKDIDFERPPQGIFCEMSKSDTVENVYALLENDKITKSSGGVIHAAVKDYRGEYIKIDTIGDLIASETAGNGKNIEADAVKDVDDIAKAVDDTTKAFILQIIRESAQKNRSGMGSYFVPEEIYHFTESRKIKWQSILKNFFNEEIIGDETSYTTPERKYLHMDLILPGHSLTEECIGEIWAFVDSSGSVGKNEIEQFLTQLYRIVKEFGCKLNICYWDTEVTDIYKNISREKDVLKAVPHHSGGTDINCVYDWLKLNKLKPEIMLILTDGWFGELKDKSVLKKLKRKTIFVLSDEHKENEASKLGKVALL